MIEPLRPISERVQEKLEQSCQPPLDLETAIQFEKYCSLLLRWNARTNLTSIRDEEGIISRHFVECIACARALPAGIGSLLDFGSGAGFPGIPIALCRPEIGVTLAESQGKKAAFLREAVRVLEVDVKVYAARAETLASKFDCVILRAVDNLAQALGLAKNLVAADGYLGLLTTESSFEGVRQAFGARFDVVQLPTGVQTILVVWRPDSE